MDLGLILSGGGSKGDFEFGAVRYLYDVLKIQGNVKLIAGTSVGAINGETHAFMIGQDRVVYRAVRGAGQTAWSDWSELSYSSGAPYTIPPMDDSPFQDGMIFRTNDTPDVIEVKVEAVPTTPDVVEFVLEAGPGIDWAKEIVIVEGPAGGTGKWTIRVVNQINRDANGLYAYQLPGGRLEFRKAKTFGVMTEVKRVDISKVKPGTRITFRWVRDS